MKISKQMAIRQDWDKVKSWNYQLRQIDKYQSVVYAEIEASHGEVSTNNLERIYYIIDGEGEFDINGNISVVIKGDVITVPANTKYNYRSLNNTILKIVLFMELWDN